MAEHIDWAAEQSLDTALWLETGTPWDLKSLAAALAAASARDRVTSVVSRRQDEPLRYVPGLAGIDLIKAPEYHWAGSAQFLNQVQRRAAATIDFRNRLISEGSKLRKQVAGWSDLLDVEGAASSYEHMLDELEAGQNLKFAQAAAGQPVLASRIVGNHRAVALAYGNPATASRVEIFPKNQWPQLPGESYPYGRSGPASDTARIEIMCDGWVDPAFVEGVRKTAKGLHYQRRPNFVDLSPIADELEEPLRSATQISNVGSVPPRNTHSFLPGKSRRR
jgi:hypothetical protein